MVLLDAKGDAIWVQVPRNLIKRFDSKIEEQAICVIAKFKVRPLTSNTKYRPLNNPLVIEFLPGTTIRPTDSTQSIPRHFFIFIQHSDIPQNVNNRMILLDVFGLLKECLPPITTTNLRGRSTRKEIKIMLLEGVVVDIVLWGRLITQLDEIILVAGSKPIILVIPCVFVTKYNGGDLKLSSSTATKLYGNLDLPEVAAFHQRFRLELSVIDSSSEALFVVLDHAGWKFFDKSAQELYLSSDQHHNGVPAVIQNFERVDVTFHVKLNSYTFKNPSHGFSIVKIVEPKGVHQLRSKTFESGQHSNEGNINSTSAIDVVGEQSTEESIINTTTAIGHVEARDESLDGGVRTPLKRKLSDEE
ncbi:unnamed protein product [Linum trigynum]|uniref:Replication protein A 70 kDa DNA-binding subunit B/D first OB fold domain-containing protein n=1 Tax=Linum trigynum TaxID=586398 RepID=A0AAV2F746_9ROSI